MESPSHTGHSSLPAAVQKTKRRDRCISIIRVHLFSAIVKDETRGVACVSLSLPSLPCVCERIDSLVDCERQQPRRNTNRNHRSPSRSSASCRPSSAVEWESLPGCFSIEILELRDEFLHQRCEHPAEWHSGRFHRLKDTVRHACE